jgi:glycosyltransferase involved in cell wall biosynthesis
MRILLVSDAHLSRELGASKVVIELAEELERLGWTCRLSSLPELTGTGSIEGDNRARALRAHLQAHAADYDVVDFGYGQLPFPRGDFAPTILLVARSVLLHHHFDNIKIPIDPTWKARVHKLVFGHRERLQHRMYLKSTDRTLAEADLVNVSNDDDETLLVRRGVPKSKIVVLPYGLTTDRQRIFSESSAGLPERPTVAFVGTFDSRKGATDFPKIIKRIVAGVPEARFRLLGTYKSDQEVLTRFPASLRDRIEVVPKYVSAELPRLLESCSVGIFPSYVEGFGFGVLEMLAAGLPVIAYNAPGPPMMLPAKYLVDIGDAAAMSGKVIELLKSRTELLAAREWSKARSRQFLWSDIARRTSEVYRARWQERQAPAR